MPSQLHQVLCAAIAEWQAVHAAYAAVYRKYLGVLPPVPFDACVGGEWIAKDAIDPASSLHAVLERGTLRIGHVDAAPYVFRATATELLGLDYETGSALTSIVARHYPEVSREPEWVLVAGSYAEESSKFTALYQAMQGGAFDVALSGQANIGNEIAAVDWLCATDLCFTNFVYTGLGGFELGTLTSRDAIVAKLKTLGPITIGYVSNNPGPSSPSAANLKNDIGDQATLQPFRGAAALNEAVATQACHFVVGDGIASSWLSLTQWPAATNLNVQVALSANPPQAVAGFTLQGR